MLIQRLRLSMLGAALKFMTITTVFACFMSATIQLILLNLALAAVVVSSRDSPVISYERAPGEGGEEGLLFNSKRPYKTS